MVEKWRALSLPTASPRRRGHSSHPQARTCNTNAHNDSCGLGPHAQPPQGGGSSVGRPHQQLPGSPAHGVRGVHAVAIPGDLPPMDRHTRPRPHPPPKPRAVPPAHRGRSRHSRPRRGRRGRQRPPAERAAGRPPPGVAALLPPCQAVGVEAVATADARPHLRRRRVPPQEVVADGARVSEALLLADQPHQRRRVGPHPPPSGGGAPWRRG